MGYFNTVAQELGECNQKLKEVRNVIDSMIADYNEVPALRKWVSKEEIIDIIENIAKAQLAIELIVTDIKIVGEKNG